MKTKKRSAALKLPSNVRFLSKKDADDLDYSLQPDVFLSFFVRNCKIFSHQHMPWFELFTLCSNIIPDVLLLDR